VAQLVLQWLVPVALELVGLAVLKPAVAARPLLVDLPVDLLVDLCLDPLNITAFFTAASRVLLVLQSFLFPKIPFVCQFPDRL
jgi:hypothetical protein